MPPWEDEHGDSYPTFRNDYGAALNNIPWDYWITLTFPLPARTAYQTLGWTYIGGTRALKTAQAWWSLCLSTAVLEKGSFAVVAIEKHKSGARHLHCLLRSAAGQGPLGDYTRAYRETALRRVWRSLGGGYTRVRQYAATGGCREYLAKYASKEDTLYFLGSWSSASFSAHSSD